MKIRNRIILAALMMGALLLPLAAEAQPFSNPEFVLKFGGAPDGSASAANGRFTNTGQCGVAATSNGQYVYVTDTNGSNPGSRVQKFDSSGNFILAWGSTGSGDGQFNFPNGIAVDAAGNVYVADGDNSRIQKFDGNGNFLLKWPTSFPSCISAGPDGYLYANQGNLSVAKFDSSGTLIATIGAGLFSAARAIAFDSAGNIYVWDAAASDVKKFDPSGMYMSTPITGVTGGGIALAIDSSDRVHLGRGAGATTAFVQVYTTSGALLGQWGSHCDLSTGTGCVDPDGIGPLELGDGQFKSGPRGISIDSAGNLYLGDNNRRVERFLVQSSTPTPTPTPTATASPTPTATSTPTPRPTRPPLSQCVQDALDALGKTADDFPPSAIAALESACSGVGGSTETTVPQNGTANGSTKLSNGDVLVLGIGAKSNGTTQSTVEGDTTTVLFIGAGVEINGNIKNIGTIYVTGPGASVSGSLTGVGTLYYLPGASLTVGGQFQVGQVIQL